MSVEMDQFKELFIQSARDHLQVLSDLLLKLESNPTQLTLVEELMRAGHSLKGESGAMGFEQITALGHVVEDLFTGIGNGSMKMENGLADVLFSAFDQISASLDAIADGKPELPTADYVKRIKDMTGMQTAPQIPATPAVVSPVAAPAVATPAVVAPAEVAPVSAATSPTTSPSAVAPVVQPVSVAPTAATVPQDPSIAPARLEDIPMPVPTVPVVMNGAPVPAVTPAPAAAPVSAAPTPALVSMPGMGEMPMTLEDIPMPTPQVGGATGGGASSVLGTTASLAEQAGTAAATTAQTLAVATPAVTEAKAPAAEQISSVTLPVDRLDQMIAISEELVLLKMRLKTDRSVLSNATLKADVHRLDRLVTDLQFYMMQARLFPISMALHTIPRLVRDTARKTEKKVRLEIQGEETTVDRTIIDHLTEPFVHLIRNAIDHGIESPEIRKAIGKDEEATVTMAAYTKENKFFVEIRDDGQGIEWDKLAAAAVKKGAITSDEARDYLANDKEKLMFMDGVSTSEVITDISGRGVGMAAVRTSIKKLGGDIAVTTVLGKGTTFTIKLPMTLAIMQALLAGVGKQIFALPANEIVRTIQMDALEVKTALGSGVVVVDDMQVFLYDLADIFGSTREEHKEGTPLTIVLVHRGNGMMGCIVDRIISEEEILVKSLGPLLKKSVHFSGATILADGSAAPIINFEGLTWKQ